MLFIYTILLWILTNLVFNLPFHTQLRLYHALINAIYGCMFIYLYQKYLLLISLIVVFMYIRSSTHFIHIQSIISYQRVIMLIKPIILSNFVKKPLNFCFFSQMFSHLKESFDIFVLISKQKNPRID